MRRLLMLLVGLLMLAPAARLHAQATAAPQPTAEQLQQLAKLLGDSAIQTWLQAQTSAAPPAASGEPSLPESTQRLVADQVNSVRTFMGDLIAGIPTLPDELGRAWLILSLRIRGARAAERRAAAGGVHRPGLRRRMAVLVRGGIFPPGDDRSPTRTARERLAAVGRRLVYGLVWILAFALGSVGGFLLFRWPPLLKQIVLGYLSVVLMVRLMLVLGRMLLPPGPSGSAWCRCRRGRAVLVRLVGVLIGWFSSCASRSGCWRCSACQAGLVLVGMWRASPAGLALFVVWRHPMRTGRSAHGGHRLGRWRSPPIWWPCGCCCSPDRRTILCRHRAAVPADRHPRRNQAVNHVLRPPGTSLPAAAVSSLAGALERGLRAVC